MSAICPHLYRDSRGVFRCEASGEEVDPGLMPCLGDYRTCRFYVEQAARRGPVAEEVREEVTRVAEVTPAKQPEEIIEERLERVSEKGVEEMEEDLMERMKEVEELAIDLNERWREYEEAARRLLDLWDDVDRAGHQVIKALNNVIDMYGKLSSSLDMMLREGGMSEATYKELKEEVTANLEKYKKLRENIERRLKDMERLVTPHLQRVKVAEAKPDLGKLRLSLMKLEELYKEGKVSEEVYKRLKSELEERIRKLEQLTVEGE